MTTLPESTRFGGAFGPFALLLLAVWTLAGCGLGKRIEIGPAFRVAVEAGASRNPERIKPLLMSEDADVQSYAWRSLAFSWSSPALNDSMEQESLVDLAIASGSPDAWHALARIPMEEHVRSTMTAKARNSMTSDGWPGRMSAQPHAPRTERRDASRTDHDPVTDATCQFIAVQGSMEDARWLMDRFGAGGFDRSPRCALAVGMLAAGSEASGGDLLRMAALMGDLIDMDAAKGILYAFSRVARHRPEPGGELHQALLHAWTDRLGVGVDPELDAWMIRSLGPSSLEVAWVHLNEDGIASESVRAMEMARTARDLRADSLSDTDLLVLSALLNHPNPSVAVMLADGFHTRKTPEAVRRLFEAGLNGVAAEAGANVSSGATSLSSDGPSLHAMNSERRLALVQALANDMEPDERRGWLMAMLPELALLADRNPYLAGRLASLYAAVETRGQTFERLERWLDGGGLKAVDAITSLPGVLAGGSATDDAHAEGFEPGFEPPAEGSEPSGEASGTPSEAPSDSSRVRGMVRLALERGERGPAFQTEPLLMDEELFPPSDGFNRWFSDLILRTYRLPDDIEVYQMAERVLSARGSASPIREAMHRHDVETAAGEGLPFRMPSWDRLERLGAHPELVLQTEKGRIVVRLETFTAPFTVSAIDALVSEGAYDGIPFHRVVANFVIQGGDVETGDGFGGPGFTIPTEISPRSFRRGRFGIASAGPDTEGSQYFIMHAWAPHLDGRYSSLGEVVEGMDVVDAIQIGDRVVRASIKRDR